MIIQKGEEKSCNCRNSKCMKLYCECYSAKVPCGTSCRCVDCQNQGQHIREQRRVSREELIKGHKGCACKRSGCTKKYCECYQAGLLCRDTCKCIDCQNNESLTNRKVINQLRRNNSLQSNAQNSVTLYPLYLSQNSEHLHSIISEANPLGLEENWLQGCAKLLFETTVKGSGGDVMDKMIDILSNLQNTVVKQQTLDLPDEQLSDNSHQQRLFQTPQPVPAHLTLSSSMPLIPKAQKKPQILQFSIPQEPQESQQHPAPQKPLEEHSHPHLQTNNIVLSSGNMPTHMNSPIRMGGIYTNTLLVDNNNNFGHITPQSVTPQPLQSMQNQQEQRNIELQQQRQIDNEQNGNQRGLNVNQNQEKQNRQNGQE